MGIACQTDHDAVELGQRHGYVVAIDDWKNKRRKLLSQDRRLVFEIHGGGS